jgi:multiple sugar transport system substrate-binding protein
LSLAACGSSGGSGGDPGVLKVAYGADYVFLTPDLAKSWWGKVKQDFEAKHPNVKVEYTAIPGGYNDLVTKLSLLYRDKSTEPDVSEIPTEQLGGWVSSGYFAPLDKYVSGADWWSRFPDSIKNMDTVDGKPYAVNHGSNVTGLWYNIPMFEKAGIPVPWQPKTWADIISAAQKVKDSGETAWPTMWIGGTGAGVSGFQYSGGPMFLGSSTPSPVDANGKWIVDSQGIRDVLQFYSDLATKGLQAPATNLLDPNSVYNQFQWMADQKMAIIITGNWLGEVWTKDVCAPCWPEANKIMGVAHIPTVNGTGNPANAVSTVGGWDLTIGANSQKGDLAWDFINIAQSKENTITAANTSGFVPPDQAYWSDPTFTEFAPPYQEFFANVLPNATALNGGKDGSSYTIWATGFTQATGAIIQKPSTTVDEAVTIMKDYVTGQLGQDKVTTQ